MQIEHVSVGSVICNKASGMSYVVTDVRDTSVIAVRTVTIYNPDEWELVFGGRQDTPAPCPRCAAEEERKKDEWILE